MRFGPIQCHYGGLDKGKMYTLTPFFLTFFWGNIDRSPIPALHFALEGGNIYMCDNWVMWDSFNRSSLIKKGHFMRDS